MTHLEKINELKNNFDVEQEITKELYFETETELVNTVGDYINRAPVNCKTYGDGKVTTFSGETIDKMIIDVAFVDVTKRFSLIHIMNNGFIKFEDIIEIGDIWDSALEAHNIITEAYKKVELAEKQALLEAEKQLEAEKKAEEKYKKLKDKAVIDFNKLANRTKEHSDVDEFYYAIGWLTKHVGTITATLPDYLESAFVKTFGSDTGCRIIDSKKRGSAGFQSQWTLSLKASLKKAEEVPAILTQYLNTSGKAIVNTSFVWDLIEDYGFKFGKTQDVEQIGATIPAKYIESFNEGLSA